MQMAYDMLLYKIDTMAIQETHIDGTDTDIIKTADDNNIYTLYLSGKQGEKRTGVEIVVKSNINSTFSPISERTCMCKTIHLKLNRNIVLICAYAHTLLVSESLQNSISRLSQ